MDMVDGGGDAPIGRLTESGQWLQTVQAILENDTDAIVVTVTEARGSTPRARNAAMVVSAARIAGSIGGGHLEWHATRRARELLEVGLSAPSVDEPLSLGPSLGQCCGGAVRLTYQQLTSAQLPLLTALDRPLFHLNLFGAGHVGQALVRTLATVPCTVRWIDERDSIFPSVWPGHISVVAGDLPMGEVTGCRAGDYYLVMTHSHARDLEIVEAILARGDAGYVGLIGSKTKRARFERQLRARGLDPSTLHCPIGVTESEREAASAEANRASSQPGLVGKEPWRIGLSVAADLLNRAAAVAPEVD